MSKWKNIFFNLFVFIIGLALFGVAGEVVIRIIYPKGIPEVYPAMFENDPNTGYRLKANYTGIHQHRDFVVTYATNSSGFRDVNHSVKKEPGVYRILVLGDSMTFGVGTPMEETYPKVLEKFLNSREEGKRYEVINTAVPGYSTSQEYNFLMHAGMAYQPDMVIEGFFGMKDVDRVEIGWQNFSAPNGYLVQKGAGNLSSIHNSFKEWILKHSKLALIIVYKMIKLIQAYQRHGNLREIPYQIYHDSYTPSFTRAIHQSEQNLSEMNRLSQSKHVRFILALIPFEMEVNKKNWIKYQLEDAYSDKVFNENLLKSSMIFSQFGRENHIPTLDLAPIFRADHPETCYFTWEAHINSNGHRLVAQSLYSFITTNHLLPVSEINKSVTY